MKVSVNHVIGSFCTKGRPRIINTLIGGCIVVFQPEWIFTKVTIIDNAVTCHSVHGRPNCVIQVIADVPIELSIEPGVDYSKERYFVRVMVEEREVNGPIGTLPPCYSDIIRSIK